MYSSDYHCGFWTIISHDKRCLNGQGNISCRDPIAISCPCFTLHRGSYYLSHKSSILTLYKEEKNFSGILILKPSISIPLHSSLSRISPQRIRKALWQNLPSHIVDIATVPCPLTLALNSDSVIQFSVWRPGAPHYHCIKWHVCTTPYRFWLCGCAGQMGAPGLQNRRRLKDHSTDRWPRTTRKVLQSLRLPLKVSGVWINGTVVHCHSSYPFHYGNE